MVSVLHERETGDETDHGWNSTAKHILHEGWALEPGRQLEEKTEASIRRTSVICGFLLLSTKYYKCSKCKDCIKTHIISGIGRLNSLKKWDCCGRPAFNVPHCGFYAPAIIIGMISPDQWVKPPSWTKGKHLSTCCSKSVHFLVTISLRLILHILYSVTSVSVRHHRNHRLCYAMVSRYIEEFKFKNVGVGGKAYKLWSLA